LMFMSLISRFPNLGSREIRSMPLGSLGHSRQIITSIHTKLQNKEHVTEVLRRAKFKFPGGQKIHILKEVGLYQA
jgi:large subunit ribosomal protein L10e